MGDPLPGEPPSAARSAIMRAVPRKHSKPEVLVRKALHRMGYRFRLHPADLPGTPDLVLPRHRLAIFVHGCFWHRHPGCRLASTPKTRVEFWQGKFKANVERDARKAAELQALGWRVATVWECQTRQPAELAERLAALLSG